MTDNKIKTGVMLVVGLLVIGLLTATIAPVFLNELNDDTSTTFNQSESESVVLTGTLNATLDTVDEVDPANIDVTINDSAVTGEQTITGLEVGANETVTVDGEDITVTNDEVHDATTATVTYEYPVDYSWGTGTSVLFGIIGLLLILTIVLFVVNWAMKAGDM